MVYIDKPIETVKNDFLGRSKFAKDLAKAISSYNEKDSLVLGLMGQWGSGKTSIINLLEEEMKENLNSMTAKQIITIKFEPWNISNQDNLISQFFATIISELNGKSKIKTIKRIAVFARKVHDFTISMFKKLVNLVGSVPITPDPTLTSITMAAKVLEPLLKNYEAVVTGTNKKDSLIGLKKKIEEQLKKLDTKFLIVIDDIDRLNSNEVCQIFQLVKAVADFPNTIYLLSFERNTVIKALAKDHVSDGSQYLEKIIHLPFEIPMAVLDKVRDKFIDEVSNIIMKDSLNEYFLKSLDMIIYPLLVDVRKMYRLLALYKFKYDAIGEEVNDIDLLNICAIEIFKPDLYNWIKKNRDVLISNIEIPAELEWEEFCRIEFEGKLDSHLKVDSVNNDENKRIIQFLFPNSCFENNHDRKIGLSLERESISKIGTAKYFDRYFTLTLETNELSKQMLNFLAREAKKEDVIKILDNNQKILEFIDYIECHINTITVSETAKKLIEILFELGSVPPNKENLENNVLVLSEIARLHKAKNLIFKLLEKNVGNDMRSTILEQQIEIAEPFMFKLLDRLFEELEFQYGGSTGTGVKADKPILTKDEMEELRRKLQDRKRKS